MQSSSFAFYVQLRRFSGFTLFRLNAKRIQKERLKDRYSSHLFRTRFNDARKLNVHHNPRLWLFNQIEETARRLYNFEYLIVVDELSICTSDDALGKLRRNINFKVRSFLPPSSQNIRRKRDILVGKVQ